LNPPLPAQPHALPRLDDSSLRVLHCSRGASLVRLHGRPLSSDFCYGLPGAIAPVGQFDPANLLADKSKGEVRQRGPAIQQIPQLPPWLWFVMTLGIGICESLRIQKGWANPYEETSNIQALKPD
ncbi:MAG: hypothetical protein SGPRY_008143, partial [Prymnesium sp.]